MEQMAAGRHQHLAEFDCFKKQCHDIEISEIYQSERYYIGDGQEHDKSASRALLHLM